MCVYVVVCEQARYKSKAKDLLKSGCNELLRPDILTALYQSTMGSKVNSHRVVTMVTLILVHKQAEKIRPVEFKLLQAWMKVIRLLSSSLLFLDNVSSHHRLTQTPSLSILL